ncbi:MAG: hypothetical protein ACXABY_01025 [Candidatus Thorarchaeota archaeon]|jgi:hypothetical protein
MPDIKVGEKVPGTYCPLCAEIGLIKVMHEGAVWYICPMKDGEAVVDNPKDAHTGYVVSTKKAPRSRAPEPVSPMGDNTDEEDEE